MLDKLPKTLTAGVTATEEGLMFHPHVPEWLYRSVVEDEPNYAGRDGYNYIHRWSQVAERLRYRRGEAACYADAISTSMICIKNRPLYSERALCRLAAVLCDDSDAFRTLHWCIHNLAQEASRNG